MQNSTEIFDVNTDMVRSGPFFPNSSHGHCGAIHKLTKQAYFVGGRGIWGEIEWVFLPGARTFDLVQRTFSSLPSQMSVGRAFHACAIMEEEGLLIAAGGSSTQWEKPDSVEILNVYSKTWTTALTLPSTSGNVWATGEVMFYWETEMYQYEAVSNTWLEIEDLPFDLGHMRPYLVQVEAGIGSFCPYT